MKTIIKGTVGEKLFELKCLEKGWVCYKPIVPQSRVDYIVDFDGTGNVKPVQVQSRTFNSNRVVCETYNIVQGKRVNYSMEDISVFVVVDLVTQNLYLLENKEGIDSTVILDESNKI